MALIDVLAVQAQKSMLDQGVGPGLGQAATQGIQLNLEAQRLNDAAQQHAQQMKFEVMKQFMDREKSMLELAGDDKRPGGARKNYLDFASRNFAAWSGTPGYSDEVKQAMLSDVQHSKDRMQLMSNVIANVQNPQVASQYINDYIKSGTGQGDDFVLDLSKAVHGVSPLLTALGQINQGKGNEEKASLAQFKELQNRYKASEEALRGAHDRYGNVLEPSDRAMAAGNIQYNESSPGVLDPNVIKEMNFAIRENNAKASKLLGAEKGQTSSYQETQENLNRREKYEKDFELFRSKVQDKINNSEIADNSIKEALLSQNRRNLSPTLISSARMSVGGKVSNQEMNAFDMQTSASIWNKAVSFLTGDPNVVITPAEQQFFSQRQDMLQKINGILLTHEVVAQVRSKQNSASPIERSLYKPGQPLFQQAQEQLDDIGSRYGASLDLKKLIISQRTAGNKSRSTQNIPVSSKKQIMSDYQNAVNSVSSNYALSPDERQRRLDALEKLKNQKLGL